MAIMNCGCPIDALTAVEDVTCKTIKPKIRAMLFRMQGNTAFVNGTNDAEARSSWEDLFDATDSPLIVRTPDMAMVEVSEPEVIEGEENYDGASTIDGILPSEFVATFHNLPPKAQKQLADLFCAGANLEVALIYNDDTMQLITDGNTPEELTFFPVSPDTIVITSPSKEGTLNAKFVSTLRFKLESDWYSCSTFIEPESGFSFIKDLRVGLTTP